MGTSYAASKNAEAETLIHTMSSELHNILAKVDTVTKKSADLQLQILSFEDRQKYIDAALEESQKIAGDISSRADRRIKSVQTYADGIVSPQQQEIKALELEIAAINRELGPKATVEPSLPPDLVVLAFNTDYCMPDKIIMLSDYMELPTLSDLSESGEDCEAETEVLHPQVETEYTMESQIVEEFSATEITTIDNESVASTDSCSPELCESAPLEKQDWTDEVTPYSELLPVNNNSESIAEIEAVWQESEESQLYLEQLPGEECISAESTPNTLLETEPQVEDYDRAEATMPVKIEEPNILHMDTTVTAWHAHSTDAYDQENHNHNWQVKVQVEVPEDDQTIIYGKVLSIVISTLSRFDDTLLNDVFPFNLIDPTDDNVARYFFNCLEDTLTMKGLHLLEISLWEGETLYTQVTERCSELDEMLKGDSIIERMRANLIAKSQVGEVPADNAGKKKFGFFGRR